MGAGFHGRQTLLAMFLAVREEDCHGKSLRRHDENAFGRVHPAAGKDCSGTFGTTEKTQPTEPPGAAEELMQISSRVQFVSAQTPELRSLAIGVRTCQMDAPLRATARRPGVRIA